MVTPKALLVYIQVIGPQTNNIEDGAPNGSNLLSFLSDGASMLVRSSLLQVSQDSLLGF